MNVLIVEDEAPKREHIFRFVEALWPSATIRVAKSVRTAIAEFQNAELNLILLDMSLPTFDVGPHEPGGRPQNFGGVEVLRYMDLYEIEVPVIVVTAYEAFSKEGKAVDHESLHEQLLREHPHSYKGLIYYNSLFAVWKDELSALIRAHIKAAG